MPGAFANRLSDLDIAGPARTDRSGRSLFYKSGRRGKTEAKVRPESDQNDVHADVKAMMENKQKRSEAAKSASGQEAAKSAQPPASAGSPVVEPAGDVAADK